LKIQPVAGQFGVGKKKQAGTTFQELNEKAKNIAAGGGPDLLGDLGNIDAMMKQMGIDPEEMKQWADAMGDIPQLDEVMKAMENMSPEELAKQMQDAMEMFTGDDMINNMLGSQDEIVAMLEEAGMVSAEEIAKFKADPEYFEQTMKESINQMKELVGNPETMANAAEGIKAAQELLINPDKMREGMEMAQEFLKNPDKANEMLTDVISNLSDEEIEEVRQMFLGGGAGDPMLKGMLGKISSGKKEDLDELLADPIKFRKSIKEGLAGAFGGQGAGVGEL